jgi:hypothetical protein
MRAMLSQNITRKSDQPIGYAFRLLNRAKQNYSTTHREALTMVFFCTSLDIIFWAISLSFM